jgi:hypothetical protein
MTEYRVIDLDTQTIDPQPRIVQASSPEHAAELVLGIKLVRSGHKKNLRARVYWRQGTGPTNMVRLYAQAEQPHPR